MKWQKPWSVRCPVCNGDGVEMKRRKDVVPGRYVIQDDPAEDREYTRYLNARWKLGLDGVEKF
jgi:hypothetical protein